MHNWVNQSISLHKHAHSSLPHRWIHYNQLTCFGAEASTAEATALASIEALCFATRGTVARQEANSLEFLALTLAGPLLWPNLLSAPSLDSHWSHLCQSNTHACIRKLIIFIYIIN